jgi:hypothetical protein
MSAIAFGQTTGQSIAPIDGEATLETRELYGNLFKLLGKQMLVGHQDDLAYGVNWSYQNGRSDINDVTGQFPSLYGWDIGHLELDSANNLDGVPFSKMEGFIKHAYTQRAVITISWHATNPLTGKSAWDVTPNTVASVLPNGSKHELFKAQLDRVAEFLHRLKDATGQPIPILFRPYHELTGNWFWWGQSVCTKQDFITLWKFTVDYFRSKKKLHNLLYVYNTARFGNKDEFLDRYPGDEFVDIISFDEYQAVDERNTLDSTFPTRTTTMLKILNEVARQKHKIPALAETGCNEIPQHDWWTSTLLPIIKSYPISYFLLWRNASTKVNNRLHFFAPFKGHPSAADFIKFSKNDFLLLGHKMKKLDIYKNK